MWRSAGRGALHHGDEIGCEQKIAEALVLFKGRGDGIEELRADDAAGAPDAGDGGHGQVPGEFLRGRFHHRKALRIGGDFSGKERKLQLVDQGIGIAQ